jgi:hypothetical protein
LTHLRFAPAEYRAIVDVCREFELGKVNLAAFGCLLSFELTETWPVLSQHIAGLSDNELRLLREQMPDHRLPEFSASEMRAISKAWGPLPLTGRFMRPIRRHLVVWLRKDHPKLARKVARLSETGFEWLCGQLRS